MSNDLDRAAPGQASTLERDSPRLDIADNDAGGLDVGISGKWERIFEAAQNTGVAEGIIAQITNLGAEGRKTDATASAFTLGYVDAMEPRDPGGTAVAHADGRDASSGDGDGTPPEPCQHHAATR